MLRAETHGAQLCCAQVAASQSHSCAWVTCWKPPLVHHTGRLRIASCGMWDVESRVDVCEMTGASNSRSCENVRSFVYYILQEHARQFLRIKSGTLRAKWLLAALTEQYREFRHILARSQRLAIHPLWIPFRCAQIQMKDRDCGFQPYNSRR
jgi:hypothetical protein